MASTGVNHPYDTRFKSSIRPSLIVQSEQPVPKRSVGDDNGSQRSDDTEEPIEIVSDAPSPSPLSLDDNAASPEVNNGEMDNDTEVEAGGGQIGQGIEEEMEEGLAEEMEEEIEEEVEEGMEEGIEEMGEGMEEDIEEDMEEDMEEGADPATIYNNPQPDDYGYAPGYFLQV